VLAAVTSFKKESLMGVHDLQSKSDDDGHNRFCRSIEAKTRSLLIAVAMIMGWVIPAVAESANGTTIPIATQIVDSRGATWTLRLSDRAVLKDGRETGASNVLQLWYLDHAVWAYSGGYWRRWLEQWQASGFTWPAKPGMPTTPGLRLPVGPQTGVSCIGVAVNPGDNIQTIVKAHPAGTTYCLAAGTHNRQSVVPKNGDQFIGAFDGTNGAVLDGQGKTSHAFSGTANYVVIRNLFIKNYTAPTQHGTIEITGAYLLLQHNDISLATRGSGVYVADHALVIANRLHHNAQQGYAVHGDIIGRPIVGVLFDSNEIDNNNPSKSFWDGGEQGGGKALNTQYLTFWYNYSHDNKGGPAFWTDWDNIYTIYWYNRVLGGSAGIEHEISYNASIIGNDIKDYANDASMSGCLRSYFACGGVMIENSGGATGPHAGIIEVADNTIRPGQYGRSITMRQQNRGIGKQYAAGDFRWNRNIWVHHNTIDWSAATSIGGGQIGAVQDTGDTKIFTSNNIRFDYNTYIQGAKVNEFTWKNRSNNSFTQWQVYEFDLHGSAR
jgi:hypothetical protein